MQAALAIKKITLVLAELLHHSQPELRATLRENPPKFSKEQENFFARLQIICNSIRIERVI